MTEFRLKLEGAFTSFKEIVAVLLSEVCWKLS